ncbi:MAG TPA: carboxypeptidase regulatory-like domain-containing protein, partial [Polyangiaceae bacterium]
MDSPRRSELGLALISALVALFFLGSVPASVALRAPPRDAPALPSSVARPSALEVMVRDASGKAIVGATVRVFWGSERTYYVAGSARTGREGWAGLDDLPAGAIWVIVDAESFARRSTTLVLLPARRSIEIVLPKASVLPVRVEDEAHAPVAGATVLVTALDTLPFGALTDSDGKVLFTRLGPGPFKFRVMARGYEPEVRSDVVGGATVTLRRASALAVTVTNLEGHAVPHATVLVAGSGLWPARSLETDAEGRARVSGIGAGAYDVKAIAGPLVSKTELGVKVERGETHAVSVVLVPGRMIPIVVTDGEGDHPHLVRDADVVLVEGGISSFPIQGRTSAFGKVLLGPIAPGDTVASARADGFVSRSSVVVPEVVTEDVRIALLRGATLRGEVVDADGRPVDGASIEVIGTDSDGMPIAATPVAQDFQRAHFAWALSGPTPLIPAGELGVMTGTVPAIPNAMIDSMPLTDSPLVAPPTSEPWVTAFDGTFRVRPIPPGRVRALVRHPEYVETTSELVTLTPG